MTHEEAKLLLSVSRECDPDPDDQELAAALKMVADDPELRGWYVDEQECICALDARFGEVAPPADLRDRILDQQVASGPWASRWCRRRALRGIAAVLVLSLLGGILWLKRPFESGGTTLAAYEKDMGTFLDRFFLLDFESEKVAEVAAWLAKRRGIEDFVIPASLAARPCLGCEVIPWQGRVTYLICFDVEGVVYHLFLLPGGADLRARPEEWKDHPPDPKWASSTWTDGNDLYYCCALDEKTEFRRVLNRLDGSTQPDA